MTASCSKAEAVRRAVGRRWDLATDPDRKARVREIVGCKRIISSSLHGLVLADTYGMPNAWLDSDGGAGGSRPTGGEFKFYDYRFSVDKIRHAQDVDLTSGPLCVDLILETVEFDERPIDFDHTALLDACPFVVRA